MVKDDTYKRHRTHTIRSQTKTPGGKLKYSTEKKNTHKFNKANILKCDVLFPNKVVIRLASAKYKSVQLRLSEKYKLVSKPIFNTQNAESPMFSAVFSLSIVQRSVKLIQLSDSLKIVIYSILSVFRQVNNCIT